MTIKEKLTNQLVSLGLWPEEAEAVMAELQAHKSSAAMSGRWDDDVEGYPSQLMDVLLLSAKAQAVEWIDRNTPQHFARSNLDA